MNWTRATTLPSFLDLVDLLGRGSTEDWQELYAEAKENAEVRALVEQALQFVDPETGEARVLWRFLLDSLPPPPDTPTANEPKSQIRERIRRIAIPRSPD